MAQKLLDQDEAARLLNVSVDELNSMRDRSQIFPKRDGGNWKYSQDEIDRVLRDREAGGSGSWGDSLSLEDVTLELNSDPDSILLNDSNIGDADDNPSTIIGRTKEPPASESDILVAGMRPPASNRPTSDSELFADLSSMSDVRLASESGISLDKPPATGGSVIAGTGMGSGLLDDLVLEPAGSSGKLLGSGSLKLDDELKLSETDSDRRRRGVESDTKKGGSAIRLADDDDDLVLGSKGDSDITIGGDSGISLVDPHDSGLSLDEPLELDSSNVESLDLGEDDMISLEEDVDLEGATQLRSDADFLLTPMDDAVDESDSGSQVIALDADDDSFGSGFGSSPGMLEEDLGGSPLGSGALVGGAALATGPALMPASYAAPEAPFSVWNVLSLLACVLFLVFGGMFMYDLVRHMWSWGTPYTINSSMMDSLIGMFEK